MAKRVLAAIDRKSAMVYAPFMWRWVMLVIKFLPRFIMRKVGFLMHRFLTIIGLFLLVLTLSPSWALPYGDDTVEQALVSAEKKLKPKKLHGLLVGDWKVEVPDDLARELQILELALDPTARLMILISWSLPRTKSLPITPCERCSPRPQTVPRSWWR